MPVSNPQVSAHPFLKGLYEDGYYPDHVVDRARDIETVAREEIAEDFCFVAQAYGFADANVEELIATRDW
jgi:hypothetical protein